MKSKTTLLFLIIVGAELSLLSGENQTDVGARTVADWQQIHHENGFLKGFTIEEPVGTNALFVLSELLKNNSSISTAVLVCLDNGKFFQDEEKKKRFVILLPEIKKFCISGNLCRKISALCFIRHMGNSGFSAKKEVMWCLDDEDERIRTLAAQIVASWSGVDGNTSPRENAASAYP